MPHDVGQVRGMFNDKGQPVVVAQPGMPVEVIGWRDLPSAGDEILQVETEVRTYRCIAVPRMISFFIFHFFFTFRLFLVCDL